MPEPRPSHSNPDDPGHASRRGNTGEYRDTRRHEDSGDPRFDDPDDPRARRRDDPQGTSYLDQRRHDDRYDDGHDRSSGSQRATVRDRDDDRTARPMHAGAGPATTVGRSSSWGPVLSGAAIAFVVFLIFSALWAAIAASGAEAVGNNLAWFQLISGILAAAAGGAAAGWLDPRGTMTGMAQGLSVWGLLVLAMTVTGVTAGTAVLGAVGDLTVDAGVEATTVTEALRPFEMELWALFAVLFGGALIAGLAGAATGRAHTMLALDDEAHRSGTARRGGPVRR
jgi:hypothetical protein